MSRWCASTRSLTSTPGWRPSPASRQGDRVGREHHDPGDRGIGGGHPDGGLAPSADAGYEDAGGVDLGPLPRAAARIIDYVAGIEPAAGGSDTVDGAADAIARTEDPALSPGTPSTELLFGWPASYWLDLREFDQVATAAALNRPILILQGGRDYQVTEADDLAGWRAGLDGRPGVSIRVFPDDDHMFFRGSGPSAPSDYQVENHVDPAVVDAIVDWLGPATRRGALHRLLPRKPRQE
ncbi:hypothetical protein KNO15_13835 [Leifsonia shinshuensis]|uniref:alpha/beta hydrolase family protein n=1 Tax=Leifsonia shinshuensis TaxID=150026 RepID=UPI001F51565A|nr:hypothetical protein [Leifsonia shinshuensis]MCI0157777.1 hypothetical protein [Leifsonia shinshuensis]